MNSLIGILSLFSTFAATSYALWCAQCVAFGTSTCTGNTMICPSGQVCGTSYLEIDVGGTMNKTVVRSCALSSECGFIGSMTIQQVQYRMGISCCRYDDCTPFTPIPPSPNYSKNGVVCRTCISATSTWCYTSDTMQCTGNETMCALQTSKITGSNPVSMAIRGCATQSICDLGSQSQNMAGVSASVKNICTNGGLSVHKVLLTPAIVCLLLLKLFF
ncbi:phospholipase A2 inhibitor and Ly6/PLAUR domain-containing protein-like [Dendrobates tinctorius]|uniref:phospholipase A2 inhibitor and Ly6/PLAUR domain-containing protein-like n=1 Tax=Dendrobates tinctorius TaxID=92724 RepID=UPI003CC99053